MITACTIFHFVLKSEMEKTDNVHSCHLIPTNSVTRKTSTHTEVHEQSQNAFADNRALLENSKSKRCKAES